MLSGLDHRFRRSGEARLDGRLATDGITIRRGERGAARVTDASRSQLGRRYFRDRERPRSNVGLAQRTGAALLLGWRWNPGRLRYRLGSPDHRDPQHRQRDRRSTYRTAGGSILYLNRREATRRGRHPQLVTRRHRRPSLACAFATGIALNRRSLCDESRQAAVEQQRRSRMAQRR
jgi:hypothetical protein